MTENWRDWEGRVVDGRFPLLQYLGGGEERAVFATVTDDRTIPKAAIRLVRAHGDDAASQVARWEATARVSHPHLVRLFQAGQCRLNDVDLIYVVMECADEDLSQVAPERTLSAAEARDMLDPALAALAYVHAQGFVHGRVRPSNLLAIGDKLKLSSDRLCPAGESVHRPQGPDVYDAPETAAAGITPAADAWSLGVTLVEALTQRPAAVAPELPPPFHDIARGCLERDPRRRWTVERIQAHLRPAGNARESAARWRYAAIAAVLLLAAAVVAGPKLIRRQQPASPPVEASRAEPAPAAPAPAPPAVEPATPAPVHASGGVLHQVMPDVLPRAQRGIRGKVKVSVKVHVDPSGGVAEAQLASHGSSRYFAGKALEAARQWTFHQSAPSEWLLHFEFDRGGTRVHSQPLAR
jgi:TonB family protein